MESIANGMEINSPESRGNDAGRRASESAVSLGAPFWFDLLNRFIVVRSTVKPREKCPEEKSKD